MFSKKEKLDQAINDVSNIANGISMINMETVSCEISGWSNIRLNLDVTIIGVSPVVMRRVFVLNGVKKKK